MSHYKIYGYISHVCFLFAFVSFFFIAVGLESNSEFIRNTGLGLHWSILPSSAMRAGLGLQSLVIFMHQKQVSYGASAMPRSAVDISELSCRLLYVTIDALRFRSPTHAVSSTCPCRKSHRFPRWPQRHLYRHQEIAQDHSLDHGSGLPLSISLTAASAQGIERRVHTDQKLLRSSRPTHSKNNIADARLSWKHSVRNGASNWVLEFNSWVSSRSIVRGVFIGPEDVW